MSADRETLQVEAEGGRSILKPQTAPGENPVTTRGNTIVSAAAKKVLLDTHTVLWWLDDVLGLALSLASSAPIHRILTGASKSHGAGTMKITSKGQVTIPQDIRERAGLMPGCEVEFVEGRDGRVSIRKAGGASRGRRIIEGLRGRGTVRMTTDEILKLTRGR